MRPVEPQSSSGKLSGLPKAPLWGAVERSETERVNCGKRTIEKRRICKCDKKSQEDIDKNNGVGYNDSTGRQPEMDGRWMSRWIGAAQAAET